MDSSIIRGLDLAVPPGNRHLEASHSSPLVPLRAWQSADNVPSGSQAAHPVLPTRVQTVTSAVQVSETFFSDRRVSVANDDPNAGPETSDPNISRRQSAAEILATLVSKSSVLQRSIDQRVSNVRLIDGNDDTLLGAVGRLHHAVASREEVRSRWGAGSVMVIENLNTKTCETLGLQYPHLDQAFLVEHMLRFDDPPTDVTIKDMNRLLPEAERIRVDLIDTSDTKMDMALTLKSPVSAQDERSFHLDLSSSDWYNMGRWAPLNVLEKMHEDWLPRRFRRESFARSVDGTWRKSSTRISCCRLPGNSVLVLVDAAFDVSQDVYDPYKLPGSVTLPDGLPLSDVREAEKRHECSRKVQPRFALAVSLRAYSKQSIFDPPVLPAKWNAKRKKLEPDRKGVLTVFMNAAFWELECLRLQEDIQYVRSYAMQNPGERSFPMLIGIRGHLGRVSDGLKKARMSILDAREGRSSLHGWFVARKDGGYDHQYSASLISRDKDKLPPIMASTTSGRPCFLDWRNLPDMLDQLGKWVDGSTKLVNEEIQLVIGAVQVEDARAMKRQTEWTVVLGVLAAIYLPMTLVTGIFGMNIIEFSTAGSEPNKWSVVTAWGVAFGATLSIVLLYMAFKILHRCWMIARYVGRRAYQYRSRGFIRWNRGIKKLQDIKRTLQKWFVVRAVRFVIRAVKELDLEAQKMD